MKAATSIVFRYLTNAQIGFLALIFTLPLYRGFFGAIIGIVLVGTIIRLWHGDQIAGFRIDWFIIGLFVYYVVSGLLTGESPSLLEKRLPLLVVPLMFALNTELLRNDRKKQVFTAFILGNFLAVLVCFVRAVVRSVQISDEGWRFDSRVSTEGDYDVFTSSVMGGNHFFGSELSYFMDQPTYFGVYLVLAQAFIYALYVGTRSIRIRTALAILYVFFAATIFLLSSKAALLTSFALTAFIVVDSAKGRLARISLLAAVLAGGLLLFFTNPRSKVFLETLRPSLENVDPNSKYGHSLRLLSWNASLEVIRRNWLFGVGEGNKETVLVNEYEELGYTFPAERRYNTHNQYMDFMLGGGVFVLLFFLFGLFRLSWQGIRRGNQMLLIFLAIFAFNLLFENLLSRHAGVVIFAIMICYLAGVHGTDRETQHVGETANT